MLSRLNFTGFHSKVNQFRTRPTQTHTTIDLDKEKRLMRWITGALCEIHMLLYYWFRFDVYMNVCWHWNKTTEPQAQRNRDLIQRSINNDRFARSNIYTHIIKPQVHERFIKVRPYSLIRWIDLKWQKTEQKVICYTFLLNPKLLN